MNADIDGVQRLARIAPVDSYQTLGVSAGQRGIRRAIAPMDGDPSATRNETGNIVGGCRAAATRQLGHQRIDADHQHAAFTGLIHNAHARSEEHTSELQSLMRISYAVFCLNKQKQYKYT